MTVESSPITDHPARAAGLASQAAVRARDKNAWLELFAEDGIVEDPIGPSGFDPEGRGHRGPPPQPAIRDKALPAPPKKELQLGD
ncbi:hypothetical protein [Nocardia cyriacigeorgica]|uniref:hypothetical protein n=1 Tax=Nocardia cyriacigeorgica TaxID=135487 RepID=UPI003D78F1D2